MASKFLNRDGLQRVLEHLKTKFAPLDSPKFIGKPMVKTPDYTRSTDGKEIINREYASAMFQDFKRYFEENLTAFHLRIIASPSDWKEKEGRLVYTRLATETFNMDLCSVFIRLDSLKLSPERYIEALTKHPLGFTQNMEIYTIGEKPTYELPLIIDLFPSEDLTNRLGG
nr:MAG TPA: hypothetical protein [Caudoviricetes sp.]